MKIDMKHILSATQQRLSETAADKAAKILKCKGGVAVYLASEDCSVSFDDAQYDFDRLDETLQLYNKIPAANVLTRVVTAETPQELLRYIGLMIKSMPNLGKVTFFNKEFNKDISEHLTSLHDAYTKLSKVA